MPKRTRDHHAWLIKELRNPVTASDYLNEALGDSPQMFLKAIRNIGEAFRLSVVARESGFRRETLYRSLSRYGNPRFKTLNAVLDVLGLGIEIKPKGGLESARGGPVVQEQHVPQRRVATVQPRARYRRRIAHAFNPDQLTLNFAGGGFLLPSQSGSAVSEGLTSAYSLRQPTVMEATGVSVVSRIPRFLPWRSLELGMQRFGSLPAMDQSQRLSLSALLASQQGKQSVVQQLR